MSQFFEYRSTKHRFELRINHVDLELIRELESKLPKPYKVIFEVETRSIRSPEEFANALKDLLSELRVSEAQVYHFTYEVFPGFVCRESPGVTGARISGRLYLMEAGLGYCRMQEFEVSKVRMEKIGQPIDIRSLDFIDAENFGRISIGMKGSARSFEERLKQLDEFTMQCLASGDGISVCFRE